MRRFSISLMLAALAVSGLARCDDDSGYRREYRDGLDHGEEATGLAGGDSLRFSTFETVLDGSVAGSDGGSANSAASRSDAGRNYSDEELLAMLLAIQETEVIFGRAAQRATDPQIQALGADVVIAHQEGRSRTVSIGIIPVPSQQAAIYLQAGLTLRTTLLGQELGDKYDDAYLELQIMLDAFIGHQIDTMLLPMAESPEVQAELTATRDAMQAQLDRAVAIRAERQPRRSPSSADAGATEPIHQDSGTSDSMDFGDEQQADSGEAVVL